MKIKYIITTFLVIFAFSFEGCRKVDKHSTYTVNGTKYTTNNNGIASWYGKKFHGRRTASGEIFNMHSLTGAHKELPFGTIVKVTNLKNKKSVIIKINDRGPYKKNRILDLSYGAAQKIDMIDDGVVKVKLNIVKRGGR